MLKDTIMNIKKSDIFSGLGVFIVQIIIDVLIYLYNHNKKVTVFCVIVSIIVTALFVWHSHLFKNKKECKLEIEKLKKENADIRQLLSETKEKYEQEKNDLEQAANDAGLQAEFAQMEIEVYQNKCDYFIETESINKKIIYFLKNKIECENTELQKIIDFLENIFKNDAFSNKNRMNTSIFISENDNEFSILISTKHSSATIKNLRLSNDSFVAKSFTDKKVMYCPDITNRKNEVPFVELNNGRKYNSILSIPFIFDDKVEFSFVITCTKSNCLEETYKKYSDVIQKYLEILGILISISGRKE